MSRYMTRMNANTLLSSLQESGHTPPSAREDLGDFILARHRERDLPVYLRIVTGIGAFIAVLCLLAFLGISKIIDFDSAAEMILWGVVFIANAIVLARNAPGRGLIGHSFLMQSSFCSVGAGKALFMFGFVNAFHVHSFSGDLWAASAALMIVTAATYPFYRMWLDRYLSGAGALVMMLCAIIDDRALGAARIPLLDVFCLLQIAAAAFFFAHGKIRRDYMPIGYAFITSLCATVGFFAVQAKIGYGGNALYVDPSFVNVSLAAGLILLIGWAAGDIGKLAKQPLLIGALGAALLGFFSAPGVILAVGLMVLGYARHERLLIAAGGLLTPLFIWCYYYNLDVSLLEKSAILVASGLVLLLGKAYMSFKGYGQEKAS